MKMKSSFFSFLLFACAVCLFNCKPKATAPATSAATDVNAARDLLQKQSSGKSADIGKEKLSDYDFFVGTLKDLTPAEDVIPYDLNTPLFSDYTHKMRFFKLPEGATIAYREKEVLDFPVGTYIIKNFYYKNDETRPEAGRRIMETRLLLREDDGWKTLPSYVWDDEQTEAYLTVEGATKDVAWINDEGKKMEVAYSVPSQVLCKSCHVNNNQLTPIGPKARQLNRDFAFASGTKNQLTHYADLGLLKNMSDISSVKRSPIWDDPSTGNLHSRALAYLDMNCGHCHSKGGPGNTSALHLTEFETNEFNLGIDKHPIAAGKGTGGRPYDIVKGSADNSIMVYRMASHDPSEMMPEVGRKLVHDEGVALITEWINAM